MTPDFNAELRREEAIRQTQGMPASVRESIWARVEQSVGRGQRGQRGVRVYLLAGAAAAIAAGLAAVALRQPAQLGEFQLARESQDLSAQVRSGLVEIERGSATLIDARSGVTLESVGPLALRREQSGVRVVRGRTNISVQPRAPGAAPAIILVSHGAIEVMGTAFTVAQGPAGGSVKLREGSIRFRSTGHVSVNLRPGEELAWPLPVSRSAPAPSATAASSATAAPSATAPPLASAPWPASAPDLTLPRPSGAAPSAPPLAPPSAAPALSADELLDRVEALRSRHQFEAAARELWRGIPSQPKPMRERLSFELGSLLTHQIRDARRACAHWAWHERSFRGGIYRDEVARSRDALKCGNGSSTP